MSLEEQHGTRCSDLLYSGWHRPASMRRYVDQDIADEMNMVNIDALLRRERWIETEKGTHEPLALIEVVMDIGWSRPSKPTRATEKLAKRARIEAYVVLVTPDPDKDDDIIRFRVRQVHPAVGIYVTLTPQEYADLLLRVRQRALDGRPMIDRVLWP